MNNDRKILVGLIAGAHGIRGDVRLRSFTEEPDSIKKYKPLTDETGKQEFKIKIKGATNNYFIASIDGLKDRDAAEALRGTQLFVDRKLLPKLTKKEFYESDLVGLAVKDEKGGACGEVIAVHNYGGGPFFEIQPPEGKSYMLPFTKAYVPKIDLEDGTVIIAPPAGWLDPPKPKKEGREEE